MDASDLIPIFSRSERDARWGRVRARMAAERLDCLIGFPNQGRFEQLQANTRYLVQIGGFATEVAVVFPLDGTVTAILQGPRDIEWWSAAQDWVSDLRPSRRLWSEAVAARLKEMAVRRVGVIGLKGLIRAPEGVVSWTMYETVRAAFPAVEFVDATQLVLETRAVKSAEEIAFIENAERIADLAVDAVIATARPGVPERVVYAAMLQTMVANGGELPTMIYWAAGQTPSPAHLVPSSRPLQRGDILHNEIEAKWGGYVAQVAVPAFIGPAPADQRALFAAARGVFDELCRLIRPGVAVAEAGHAYRRLVEAAGGKPASWPFHGRGLGDDLPAMPNASSAIGGTFEEGHVMVLKPGIMPPGASENAAMRVTDTVVVTRDGARRLGKRPLAMAELPSA
jgi:Xaa-Pro aminopeptidase